MNSTAISITISVVPSLVLSRHSLCSTMSRFSHASEYARMASPLRTMIQIASVTSAAAWYESRMNCGFCLMMLASVSVTRSVTHLRVPFSNSSSVLRSLLSKISSVWATHFGGCGLPASVCSTALTHSSGSTPSCSTAFKAYMSCSTLPSKMPRTHSIFP